VLRQGDPALGGGGTDIYATTHRSARSRERRLRPVTRLIDLDDPALTENTRASYPLEFIHNAIPAKRAGHPKNVIFLTCDASGVMPPIAKLSVDQARYQFISGYTSKIAGTEVGWQGARDHVQHVLRGAVHGAPARLLRAALEGEGAPLRADCWLVNTGWVGGQYGVGKRISIRYTRAM